MAKNPFFSRARGDGLRSKGPGVGQPVAATVSLIVLATIITLTISPTIYFERWDFERGEAVPRDLQTPFTVTVEDPELRSRMLREARESAPHVYIMHVDAAERTIAKVDQIFDLIESLTAEAPPEPSESEGREEMLLASLEAAVRAGLGVDLTQDTLQTLVQYRSNEQFREEIAGAFNFLLRDRGLEIDDRAEHLAMLSSENRLEIIFRESDGQGGHRDGPEPELFSPAAVLNRSQAVTGGFEEYMNRSLLRDPNDPRPRVQEQALRELVDALIIGNIYADTELTSEHIVQAEASVRPGQYSETLRRGEMIARTGSQLDRWQRLVLDEIEELKPYYLVLNVVGNAILVVSLLVFIMLYLKRFRADWSYTTPNVNIVGLPLVLVLLTGRILLLAMPNEPTVAGLLFPAGALGMLGVILIGPRVGMLILASGCLLFGVMTQMNFQLAIVGIIGGAAAVASLYVLRRRLDIMRAALTAGGATAVAILVIRFIDNPALMAAGEGRQTLIHMGWGLGNGLLSWSITLVALVTLESVFRVTTDLNLIELTSLRTPLLRELEEKTPGTYQHTLNVTKLAEAAAEAIGANYLLVRAGAHYHDIGKMVKPKYFTENQATAEERRVHSKLAPPLSALIIKEHVKRGVDLARAHRLPEKVIDFIPQHHGTSLIRYFHTEAQRRFAMGETSDPVREEEFRYPGPKPQYVETAILMLADAVEATATAKLSGASVKPDDVERLVRDTIREKFNDGQLDECNLTLSDLGRIRESFVHTLLARYHQRVDYPAAQSAARGA